MLLCTCGHPDTDHPPLVAATTIDRQRCTHGCIVCQSGFQLTLESFERAELARLLTKYGLPKETT